MFYIYNDETKEFLGETEGQPNPLEGGFFTPPFSTTIQPSAAGVDEAVVWNGTAWDVVADNRGKDYWYTATKEKVAFGLGTVIDATMTNIEPLPDSDAIFNGVAWEVPAAVLEERRKSDITNKATSIIEAAYSPLKQRKLMSVAITLQDKQIQGVVLTADEEALLQQTRDVNLWITNIRNIENIAIENGTELSAVVWQ